MKQPPIYELPSAAPYAVAPGCSLAIISRQAMRSICPAPTRLLRREMYDEGWNAKINGAAVPVAEEGLFQSIPLPAGPAFIRFSYVPPHIALACILALLGLGLWLWALYQGRQRHPAPGAGDGGNPPALGAGEHHHITLGEQV